MMKMTNAMTENIKRNGAGFYSRVFDTFLLVLFIAIQMMRTMESDILTLVYITMESDILSLHDVYLLIRQNFGDTRTVLFDRQGAKAIGESTKAFIANLIVLLR